MDDQEIAKINQAIELIEGNISELIQDKFGVQVAEFLEYDFNPDKSIAGQLKLDGANDVFMFKFSGEEVKLAKAGDRTDAAIAGMSDEEFDQIAEVDTVDVLAVVEGILGRGDR